MKAKVSVPFPKGRNKGNKRERFRLKLTHQGNTEFCSSMSSTWGMLCHDLNFSGRCKSWFHGLPDWRRLSPEPVVCCFLWHKSHDAGISHILGLQCSFGFILNSFLICALSPIKGNLTTLHMILPPRIFFGILVKALMMHVFTFAKSALHRWCHIFLASWAISGSM